jgi:small conductance mechanosensitive channel
MDNLPVAVPATPTVVPAAPVSFAERFSPTGLLNTGLDAIPSVLSAIFTFALFFVLWKVLARTFRFLRDRLDLDPTLASFIESTLKYVVLIMGLLSALSEVGINTTSMLASLGVVGLTVGFAAKDTLSNVISGVFIFWDRPFVLGDLVEINGQYGRVDSITMRSTRVVTVDGKMLAVPNSTVVNSTVVSYTNFPNLRLDVAITVGVQEDLNRIRTLFAGLVEGDARFMQEPAPAMVLKNVGDYFVEVEFRVWLEDETTHVPVRFWLREQLFEAFRTHGVEMPYETVQLAPFEHRSLEPKVA